MDDKVLITGNFKCYHLSPRNPNYFCGYAIALSFHAAIQQKMFRIRKLQSVVIRQYTSEKFKFDICQLNASN